MPMVNMWRKRPCQSVMACPPDGTTQALLNKLGRHGNRPSHVHYFISAPGYRKLTTQFNIEGDQYLWDDFAFRDP